MFVYTLKLDANNKVKQQLNRRFKMAQDIYRRTIQEIVKRAEKQKKTLVTKKSNRFTVKSTL